MLVFSRLLYIYWKKYNWLSVILHYCKGPASIVSIPCLWLPYHFLISYTFPATPDILHCLITLHRLKFIKLSSHFVILKYTCHLVIKRVSAKLMDPWKSPENMVLTQSAPVIVFHTFIFALIVSQTFTHFIPSYHHLRNTC